MLNCTILTSRFRSGSIIDYIDNALPHGRTSNHHSSVGRQRIDSVRGSGFGSNFYFAGGCRQAERYGNIMVAKSEPPVLRIRENWLGTSSLYLDARDLTVPSGCCNR